jgi:hypothetical protein
MGTTPTKGGGAPKKNKNNPIFMQRMALAFDLCPEPNTEIMQRLGLLAMLVLLALSACRKNVDDVIITDEPYLPHVIEFEPVVSLVQGSLTGFVVDADGTPVEDAQVQLGNQQTSTDAYGHFFFRNIQMNSKGQFLTVNKAGYFEGSRRFFPLAGKESRVKVELLPKVFSHSFESQLGATVETNGGARIVFPASAIRTANGDAYTGTVQVAAFWMDPSSPDILEQMPGNLQGISTSATEVALATFGMMAVELQSPSGQKLNIAEGSKATLSMPIPQSMQANAPQTMPLWSFYNGYGLWVEEGEATRQGDRYVGEVSHFSFWNCDLPYTFVDFSAHLEDEEQNPVFNMKVLIRLATGAVIGYDFTDANGNMTGKLPEGVELILEVYGPCNYMVYSENIGPFTGEVDLGTYVLVDLDLVTTTIIGTAIDCNGEVLEEGLIMVSGGLTTTYHYFDNGSFELDIITCGGVTELNVAAADFTPQQGASVTLAVGGTQYVSNIIACGQFLDEFVLVKVNDITTLYVNNPSDSLTWWVAWPGMPGLPPSFTGIFFTMPAVNYSPTVPGTGKGGGFWFDGHEVGDYTDYPLSALDILVDNDLDFSVSPGGSYNMNTFVVTEYGNIGEPIAGYLNWTGGGGVISGVTQSVEVSITFRVYRTH